LTRTWWDAVQAHPMAYLRHRIGVLRTILQIRGIYDPYHQGIDPNEFGLTFPPRPLYESVLHGLDRMTPLLFRSWFFVIAAIGVVWCGRSLHNLAPIAIVLSGLFYAAPYVVVSGGSDFRYVWWLVLAALFGLVVLTKAVSNSVLSSSPA